MGSDESVEISYSFEKPMKNIFDLEKDVGERGPI